MLSAYKILISAFILIGKIVHSEDTGKLAALQADASLFSQIPFDYIIIGGGTAGLTVATRLTEDPDVTVGVIEAGLYHPNEPLIATPGRYGQAIGSDIDWGYLTTPQSGGNNNPVLLASGKMLGGSSGLNFMAWTRASKPEYDAWETLGNGPTWNWEALLPYFKKVETYKSPPSQGIFSGATAPTEKEIETFHGLHGPVKSSFNDMYGPMPATFVESMNSMGISTNSDPGNGDAKGVFNVQAAVDREQGTRSYSANAYFGLSANRPNLHVLTSAKASKILFSRTKGSDDLVASAVRYTFGIQEFTATVKKEVIISAGTMQTPKILELSGIGNKTLLDKLGVETLLDLPQVGENLQDQPLVARDFLVQPDPHGVDEMRNNLTFALLNLKQYEKTHNGLYTHTTPVAAFLPLADLITNDAENRIAALQTKLLDELHDASISPLYRAQLKIQRQWLMSKEVAHVEFIMWDGGGMTHTPPAPNSTYLTVFTSVQHPFSRGSIHINSSNPLELPVIDPRYLQLSIDADALGFTGTFMDELTKTPPLAKKVIRASTPPPGSNFVKYMRENLGTIWHPVGTAALAPRNLGGVVDPSLKVYGTQNVRVVDASVFPLHLSAHPTQTIYAIAEKAADMIKTGRTLQEERRSPQVPTEKCTTTCEVVPMHLCAAEVPGAFIEVPH